MAGELTTTFTQTFKKGSSDQKFEVKDRRFDVPTTKEFVDARQVVGLAAEPLDVGDVPAGYRLVVAVPSDEVNFVKLRVGAGGTDFAKIVPGDFAYVPLDAGITGANAIHVIADTAAVSIHRFLTPRT